MLAGLLLAAVAAVCYGSSSVLQAVGVRRAGGSGPASGGGAALAVALGRQPLYVLGLVVDGVGFVASVVALQFLPLFVVQAVVAANVAVTALLAAATGTALGRSAWTALAATAVGLVLLSVSGSPGQAEASGTGWQWALLALVLPLAAVPSIARHRRRRSEVLACGAGLGFTVVAVAARSVQLPAAWWHVLGQPSLWAVVSSGVAALVLFTLALDGGSVTAVSAVVVTVETVLPAVVGVTVLGDRVRTGSWPIAVVGFVLAVGGAVALARFGDGVPDDSAGGTAAAAGGLPG
ncbi:hypothetical protein [Nakamurella endophytica]|uniref:Membrane protein n=1 Tax=Nakamurella endophytica TaxID=1748367 RepID=A0A917SQ59_9ACTN|nr:hypothetical protein [Nakamurella endophytica]GGL92048.1 membrane protein [Nakamurella endophytica]